MSLLKKLIGIIHGSISPVIPDSVDILQKVDLSMCESVINIYLELLLSSTIVMNIIAISRLNEDLEMLTTVHM
jgi:hypothetical protein